MIRSLIIAAIGVFFAPCISNAQVTAQWTSIYNGIASDTDEVSAMTVDDNGNVYITGFSKTTDHGYDIVTLKYNSAGQQLWAARYNNETANSEDIPTAIACDHLGNTFVAGRSTGAGTFFDIIVLKYSPDGTELWRDRYNGEGNDEDGAAALAVDATGNLIVTGFSVGFNSSEDFITMKYNEAGARLWLVRYNNPEEFDIDMATSLTLDALGGIYVAGVSNGTGTQEDIAVVKYDASGIQRWVARYNNPANTYDIPSGIALDQNMNTYVSGYSLNADGNEDYVTIKLNSGGGISWSRNYNGANSGYDISTGVVCDVSGNCAVTGYSFGGTTGEDYATVKYDGNGNQLWVRRFDGPASSYDISTGIKTDNSSNIYVTGYSLGMGSFEDFTTIKYDREGNMVWTGIYDGPLGDADIANSLAVDMSNNVYVSGFSFDGDTGFDYVTIKYSQTVGINSNYPFNPGDFILHQNFPNPYNPGTTIRYELNSAGDVLLRVFDISGKEIAVPVRERKTAGTYEVRFEGIGLPSGVYYYSLSVNGMLSETKSMILVK